MNQKHRCGGAFLFLFGKNFPIKCPQGLDKCLFGGIIVYNYTRLRKGGRFYA